MRDNGDDMRLLQPFVIAQSVPALLVTISCCADTAKNAASAADYVLTNEEVYTVNEKQPWAEAIAVKGNEIVFVGA